jgi:hypothetical protein
MPAKMPHLGKVSLFALLSLADLYLTWLLLAHGQGRIYESNPLARWWLEQYGWLGLAAFKLSATLLVVGLAVTISAHRPRTGGWVLTFACSILALVILYSSSLAGFIARPSSLPEEADLVRQSERDRFLDQRIQEITEYNKVSIQVRDRWLAEHCTVTEAVERLARTANAQNTGWLRVMRGHYPDCTTEQCLAANLLDHALALLESDPAAYRRVVPRLVTEYQAAYGVFPPCRIRADYLAG